MKHHIVSIDGWVKIRPLNFEYTEVQYKTSTLAEIPERVRDATIIVSSATKVTREAVENAPNLQLVAVNGVGYDKIDMDALRERGIWLCNIPAQNTDSVSEHAFALYYALRRHIVPLHNMVLDGKTWPQAVALHLRMPRPPRTNSEETLVVIGHGALGQNVAKIGKALGMRVIVAERKGATDVREGRVSFAEALRVGTLFMFLVPLDAGTRDMIGPTELAQMDSTAVLVNVGRGGIINETALAEALRKEAIGGAATDVYEHEPATPETCPLLDSSIPNLVLSPHIAWFSSKTVTGTTATAATNLEAFAAAKPQNVILEGRPFW